MGGARARFAFAFFQRYGFLYIASTGAPCVAGIVRLAPAEGSHGIISTVGASLPEAA